MRWLPDKRPIHPDSSSLHFFKNRVSLSPKQVSPSTLIIGLFFYRGAVRYVRLGELDLNSTTDDANVTEFTVAEITTHPLYNFGSNYHDIALLRLNATITSFNDYVKPACLATTRDVENANLKIAGWGVIENNGPQASILQTAFLQHVPHERCRRSYGRSAKLRQGIIEDVHVCADGGTERRDACNVS